MSAYTTGKGQLPDEDELAYWMQLYNQWPGLSLGHFEERMQGIEADEKD